MAVKIRLRRMGAKKAPFYRVVVADSRYPRDGRFIEEIGYYNPLEEPAVIKIDREGGEMDRQRRPAHRYGEGAAEKSERGEISTRKGGNRDEGTVAHDCQRAGGES